MKIFDFEAHFYTEEYLRYLRSNKEPPRLETREVDGRKEERLWLGGELYAPARDKTLTPLLDLGKNRIAKMDEVGVTVQVLGLSGPGCELFEPKEAIVQARKTNDEAAEAMKRHPGRFLAFASLAAQAPDAAADELERTVKGLGFKGALINSHVRGGEYLDDKKYWAIFEKAERLGVPLYLHPRIPSPQMLEPYAKYGYTLTGATLGYAAETSLHAMRLIMGGVFDRYPKLKIILGHLGEALPFWLDRIDGHYGGRVPIAKKPSQYLRDNFLMTLSGNFYLPAFMCVYLALGADNILFGSDYPYEDLKRAALFAEGLPISDTDKRKICYANAEALLGLS